MRGAKLVVLRDLDGLTVIPVHGIGGIDALEMTFRTYKLRIDPNNAVNWDNRDAIEIAEYDELCAPHLSH